MADRSRGSHIGKFTFPDGYTCSGEIEIAGKDSSIHLYSDEVFLPGSQPFVHAVMLNGKKASFFNCIREGATTGNKDAGVSASVRLFPHFVLSGDVHLVPEENCILGVNLSFDDASTLFYDFDAFSTVLRPKQFIQQLIDSNKPEVNRAVPIGDCPEIKYFTGRRELIRVETSFGVITARHSPTTNIGGPEGVWIRNRIVVAVEFMSPRIFHHAIDVCLIVRNFLGLIIGRPQKLLGVTARVQKDGAEHTLLVDWSFRPSRKKRVTQRKVSPIDCLVKAVEYPVEFEGLLASWLARHESWRTARNRFFESFSKNRHYTTERLIASANTFDLLPSSAIPAEVELDADLKDRCDETRKVFRKLPKTPERDSVLSALGRVGKCSLKQKVRFRSKFLLDALRGRFANLDMVTDQAVDCRNFFVHGGVEQFDYGANWRMVNFFTDTLEFVFAASDLVEAGWNIARWLERTSIDHPFGGYCESYKSNLNELRALMKDND